MQYREWSKRTTTTMAPSHTDGESKPVLTVLSIFLPVHGQWAHNPQILTGFIATILLCTQPFSDPTPSLVRKYVIVRSTFRIIFANCGA